MPTNRAWMQDADTLHGGPDDMPGETTPDDLDLGKLGHAVEPQSRKRTAASASRVS